MAVRFGCSASAGDEKRSADYLRSGNNACETDFFRRRSMLITKNAVRLSLMFTYTFGQTEQNTQYLEEKKARLVIRPLF